jgi:hypothetical protein
VSKESEKIQFLTYFILGQEKQIKQAGAELCQAQDKLG